MDKLLDLAKEHMSNNCKDKLGKICKLASKIEKKAKSGEYVSTRDGIVIGLSILTYAIKDIELTHTNKDGRDKLNELKDKIIKLFKEVE